MAKCGSRIDGDQVLAGETWFLFAGEVTRDGRRGTEERQAARLAQRGSLAGSQVAERSRCRTWTRVGGRGCPRGPGRRTNADSGRRSGSPALADLAADATRRLAELVRGTLYPVINATGVIIHTNLGRAPLSAAARAAMDDVAAGYSNLEYDLEAGERGSRYLHAEKLLCQLTGAEAALAVNNNAGAVFLALTALAQGRDVVISRGQLVEIGGGFRIPDVMRQSGARLVEVGTTNRTHLADFEAAIDTETALLLRVHSSNFRQIGFVSEVSLAEMVRTGAAARHPGARRSGQRQPARHRSLRAGLRADGAGQRGSRRRPGDLQRRQAARRAASGPDRRPRGVGGRIAPPPAGRALRVDKSTLAALQATLLHYLRGEAEREVPVWRMIAMPLQVLEARAAAWAAELRGRGIPATVVPAMSTVGGGSLPGEVLPTRALAVTHPAPHALALALRRGAPPIVGRIAEDRLILDPRTVPPEMDEALVRAVAAANR